MCLKFIDTEQEKAIDLGVSWPYEKLAPNECLVSSEFAGQGVKKGDKIIMSVYEAAYWKVLIEQYNHAALENGWPTIDAEIEEGFQGRSSIECTVKDLFTKTYGKMPDEGADKQIIMEFESYVSTWYD